MSVMLPSLGRRSSRTLPVAACLLLAATTLWLQVLHEEPLGGPLASPRSGRDPGNASRRLDVPEIQRLVERHNELQAVLNQDVFGPVRDDTIIVVVQVHKRITYLRHLIVSLGQARGIDSVLLVFSHDFYDEEINELVQSVDFCKVMQIFYPHSIQTHPHEFPGESPDDCPRNIKKEQAIKMQCTNALHPDSYGHYREARFTQIKHHWWWKANRVFNQLKVTRTHEGLVLFLEEDHYVAEDFIHILRLMQATCRSRCPRCNVLSLGTYQKRFNYNKESNQATVAPWLANKHNMGMVLNSTTWNSVLRCARAFCEYDDYNWDWSLQVSAQECLREDLVVMMMKQARVFHLGECGLHHNKANCEPTAVMAAAKKTLLSASEHLFPAELSVSFVNTKRKKLKKNGGWGDARDHQLCLNISLVDR